MNALDRQAVLAAGLESLGELREQAIAGRPIDRATFDAAITVIASALDDDGREALAGALPARKATLGADDLGVVNLLVAEMLMAATPVSKGATKALVWVPDRHDPYEAAADNLRAVIASEDRAHKARVAAESDAAWLATWTEHGRRRRRLVSVLAGAVAR